MKKVLFIAAIAVFGYTAQAQTTYGLKAGINLANFGGADAPDGTSTLLGINGGAFVNIPVAGQFSVQPELLYSGEGAKVEGGKYLASYINIPVLAQYKFGSGFFGQTGPQVGLLMSAKVKPDGGSSVDVKDEFKSTGFSWAIGAGYKHESGFGVTARYNLGLSTIVDASDVKVNSNVIAISVFYTLGGKAKK